ncbi:MAG: O-linked N-acetylglucosamine transferase, SPINDLY family protein [Cyanobacteria bacterium J06638_20]
MTSSDPAQVQALQHSGQQALQANRFEEAIACFAQLAEQQPEVMAHRVKLGLSYLLVGQEDAAQLTWAMAFSEADEAEQVELLATLIEDMQAKAEEAATGENWPLVWALTQHLAELTPEDLNVRLQGILAASQCQLLTPDLLEESGLAEALGNDTAPPSDLDRPLLEATLEAVVEWDRGDRQTLAWIVAVASPIENREDIANLLVKKATQIRFEVTNQVRQFDQAEALELAIAYTDAAIYLHPTSFNAKYERIAICIKKADFVAATAYAEALISECASIQEKICTEGLLIQGLIYTPGHWGEALVHLSKTRQLFDDFIEAYRANPTMEISAVMLMRPVLFFQYVEDNPADYRALQNQLSNLYAENIQTKYQASLPPLQPVSQPDPARKLRIGFLSEFLIRHPIGLLSRWIFQHFDRDRFEFHTYLQNAANLSEPVSPFSQEWFVNPVTEAHVVTGSVEQVAQAIRADQLDILIDLDSLTSAKGYALMALRLAPIQITWLGFDATGLPTVDYVLADPFVLPETADKDYAETLWRLPQTYIAVDGFEVGVPTLRRDQLGIPADAVVYFSVQVAAKRHPDTMRWQIEILKQVPNSYLLVKGISNSESLQAAFLEVAQAAGVSSDRLRFLDRDPDEPTHRANLEIADVVLDTFPYTGATTTLETLWMGIPLVMRVGQQFASRNSYTMLRNAGIDTGIAHSAEEYIAWGVRYGTDADLRNHVRERLRRSRQTAPLWNAKQFTRNLEAAFEQMWKRYLKRSAS